MCRGRSPTSARRTPSAPGTYSIYLCNAGGCFQKLGQQKRTIGLGKGAQYTPSLQLKLPNNLDDGEYFLRAVTDSSGNQLFEENETNNSLDTVATLSVSHPDLVPVIEPQSLTALSGETVQLSWHVENRGDAGTLPVSWTDQVYLADLSGNSIATLGWYTFETPLAAGGASDTVTISVQIPQNVIGNYTLVVKTDVENTISETSDESNNLASVAIHVERVVPGLM